jgi:cytochrome P450
MASSDTAAPEVALDPLAMFADPYPTYATLRREAPVAWSPTFGRFMVSRYQDVIQVSRDWETFTAHEEGASENRVVGETLMTFDGEENHLRLRRMLEGPLKPRAVREHWEPVFRANTTALLDEIADRGHADLFTDFATTLAAMNLSAFLGFDGVSPTQTIEWCKGIIDSGGNIMDDPEIWERGFVARAGVIEAVDAAVERVRSKPDPSMISSMVNSDDPMTPEQMYSNVMISIGGGLNEPRDALLTAVYGLLTNPDQLAAAKADPALWRNAFEESCRWVAPIGMFIREVAKPVELSGVNLEPGDKISALLASANRDEEVFDHPDDFDIYRKGPIHLSFGGGGPHYCIGAWASRASTSSIILPSLFERLPNLRLDPAGDVTWGGMVFRGPLSMPVLWDA